MSYRRGFTLIELLIFIGIFAVIAGVFVTILVSIVNVQGHQSVTDEIQQQGQFLEQQINYYVQNARLVDMPLDTATGTLELRESLASSSLDPTIIAISSTALSVVQLPAPAVVQTCGSGGNELASITCMFSSPINTGDILLAAVSGEGEGGATSTATISGCGATWVPIATSTGGFGSWYAQMLSGYSPCTVTMTESGGRNWIGDVGEEVSGVQVPMDAFGTAGSDDGPCPCATPSTTTSASGDFIDALLLADGNNPLDTITVSSPFIMAQTALGLNGGGEAYYNQPASGTISAMFNTTGGDGIYGYHVQTLAFKKNYGPVYLTQGIGGSSQALTSNRVTVSNLYFTRHYNVNSTSSPYGTDSVSYSFTVSAQGGNQLYSQTFQSSANVFAPVPAVALVQQAKIENNSATSTSLSEGYASANESGDLLLAVVANKNLVTSTITDTAGNTWTQIASATYSAYSEEVAIFAAPNALAAANTTTVTFGGAGANSPSLFLYEYRDAATSSPLDVWGATTTADTAAPTSPTVSPGSNVELLFGVDDNAYPTTAGASAGAGFTLESSSTASYSTQVFAEDMDQYITGAVSAPWTFNSAVSSTAMIATFIVGSTVAEATSTCGPTVQTGLDSGDGYQPLSVPCVTGSDGNGYSVSSISYWVGTPTSANFTLGVYSDSSSNPDTLLCSVTVGTSTPSSGWNTINMSGCPTLSANTMYWVGYMTSADGIEQGRFAGDCPGTTLTAAWENNLQSTMALPDPFGGNGLASTCYDLNMTLTNN